MNNSEIPFIKIHGNGNDFIYFQSRDLPALPEPEQIRFMCDRHKGIGADGILIQDREEGYDFRMLYFNSDGNRVDFCGNGARCISYLAGEKLGKNILSFIADDGPHISHIQSDGLVSLEMRKPEPVSAEGFEELLKDLSIPFSGYLLIDTGVPHVVIGLKDVSQKRFYEMDILDWSRSIRFHRLFPSGINVNFTIQSGDVFLQRTYERGVEAETLSCGTGSVAVALYWQNIGQMIREKYEIKTIGGTNWVTLNKERPELIGQVTPVFRGFISLP